MTVVARSEPLTAASAAPWWRRLPSSRLILWVWIVALSAVRAGTLQERDPYWETRAGIENLTGTPFMRPDSWSWAPVPGSFYPNSPGWNILLALAWFGGRYWGLFLFTFAVLVTYFGLSYVLARRLGAHPLGALAGIMVCAILAMPMLSARGTIGVQLLLCVGIFIPLWWQRRLPVASPIGSALMLFALGAGLSALGNWIHLSFVAMSVALAAGWATFWLLSDWPDGGLKARLRDPRRWAAVLGGGTGLGIGVLATPYGIGATLEHSRATAAVCVGLVVEWVSPFTPMASAQWVFVAVCMLLVLACIAAWFLVRLRRGGIDQTFALVSAMCVVGVPFAVAGMFALRFLGVGALMLVPVVSLGVTILARRARAWAQGLSETSAVKEAALRWTRARSWTIVLTLVSALLLPFAAWMGPGNHAIPQELEAIRALPSGCHLFTSASIAGTTILERPDVPVWFDGRFEYYGRQRILEATRYLSGKEPTAAPPGATCALLPVADPVTSPATARLDADPAWKRMRTYSGFDVWVRAA